MLESLIRCSRHRWTLLKLPPRRMERRLTGAAHWFSEQISRNGVGHVDLIFASEALNLADLFRMVPVLVNKPSIVYFHKNQLPNPSATVDGPLDFINLNSATAASEIWFNSMFHLRSFLARATALVRRHPELAARTPMPSVTAKSHLMPPPVNLSALHELVSKGTPIRREKRTILVDTQNADMALLNAGLNTLSRRGENYQLLVVGSARELDPNLPHVPILDTDEQARAQASLRAGIVLSAERQATCDHHAICALTAGCWPVLPADGVYPELIPQELHGSCLYDGSADMLASRLQDAFHLQHPDGYGQSIREKLQPFDPIIACRAMDQRMEELAVGHTVMREDRKGQIGESQNKKGV